MVQRTVYFHNFPLEKIDDKKKKVDFTCKGISHIEVKGNLEKYEGKEKEYIVKNDKLKKRLRNEVKAESLHRQLAGIKNEIARKISSQISIHEELKIVKGYMVMQKAQVNFVEKNSA